MADQGCTGCRPETQSARPFPLTAQVMPLTSPRTALHASASVWALPRTGRRCPSLRVVSGNGVRHDPGPGGMGERAAPSSLFADTRGRPTHQHTMRRRHTAHGHTYQTPSSPFPDPSEVPPENPPGLLVRLHPVTAYGSVEPVRHLTMSCPHTAGQPPAVPVRGTERPS